MRDFVSLGTIAALICIGCASPSVNISSSSPSVAKAAAPVAPDSTPKGAEAKAAPSTPDESAQSSATVDEVPEVVKTPAFDYYGLANLKPFPMEKIGDGHSPQKGTATTTLVRVVGNTAFYDLSYTGGLDDVPTTRVEATKKGIYTVQISGESLLHPQLELPADPKPGYRWTVNAKFTDPGGQLLHVTETDRVVGPRPIKVAGKKYEALYVEASGTLTMQAQGQNPGKPEKHPYKGKKWFVKGLGPVKTYTSTQTKAGEDVSMTLQATQ